MTNRPTSSVRACFDSLRLASDMAPRTAALRAYQLSIWSRFTGNPQIAAVDIGVFKQFQATALNCGYAPESIETMINAVMAVLRAASRAGMLNQMPDRPKRLNGKPAKFSRLSILEFDQFIRAVPEGITGTRGRSAEWWLGWWGLLYFSALRLADALSLERQCVGFEGIEVRQTKTGGLVRIPVNSICRRLLEAGSATGKLFPISRKTLYRITGKICDTAGLTRVVTPQMVRVLSARQYERAHPGAGRLILGRGFPGADRYYFDPVEILQSANSKLEVPESLMTADERAARASAEMTMLSEFRRLKEDQREAVLKIAKSMRSA